MRNRVDGYCRDFLFAAVCVRDWSGILCELHLSVVGNWELEL